MAEGGEQLMRKKSEKAVWGTTIAVVERRECKQMSMKSDDRTEGKKKKVELELSGRKWKCTGGSLYQSLLKYNPTTEQTHVEAGLQPEGAKRRASITHAEKESQ